ncbi:MAG: cob(I)yrinic acid a,c-diamide adenosyltransferase [bacterium]
MLAIITGEGKGKTTSAFGTALRAVGWGKKVLIIQFIKSKEFPTGEKKAIEKFLSDNITIKTLGLGFVGIMGDTKDLDKHRKKAKEALKKTEKLITLNHYDLIILDEILGAIKGHLLTTKKILKLIELIDKNTDVILTGRLAPKSLVDKADLVSEIKKVKHPYDKGILAKKGFDF